MGGTLYDGDDSRHVSFLHDDTIPKASHTSSKRVVAAIGFSLCVASALVGYSMMTSETTQSLRMPSVMNLESEQTTSNREFLLQIRGKNSLCIDDGGSTQPTFITQPCNPSDINQMFVYDPVLFRIRSARKTNLCVDDGGGLTGSQVRLWTCDQYNSNQRWVYDPTTLMFKNPTKNNLCLDDGGGTLPRSTNVILSTCDVSSLNQHFQIKFVDDGQAQQQATIDAVQGGAKFILRVPGKDNLCVDDANTVAPGSAILNVGTCDVENANQVFVWDLTLKRIRSFKKGWCVDDGGGQTASSSNFILSNCDGTSKNQEFVYDKTTLQFRNPNKPNLCIDDGNGFSPGTGKLTLWYCELFNSNQHFEYVLVPSNKTYPVPNLLQMGREFLLKLRGKNSLCVNDGGNINGMSSIKVRAHPCNPSDVNQMFVYDTKTYQLRSARKNNLCLDDGQLTTPGSTSVSLLECDINSNNQRWVYNATTQMFINPTKNLCLDDGSGTKIAQTLFTLWTCDNNSPNQHFEVKFVDDWQTEQQKTIDAIQAGAKFIMRVPGKDNLCVDDANTWAPGSSNLWLWTCDVGNMNQVFVWDATLKRIRSYQKGWCVDDGGGRSSGSTNFILSNCDGTSKNQEFVYDKTTLQFRNPNKPNLCVDDNNGYAAGTGKLVTWYCDVLNPNQHFEYVLVSSTNTYPVADLCACLA